ncbi:hypothetical protein [Thermofilum sp.]
MAKCTYRGKKIRKMEEKWIDENVGDGGKGGEERSFVFYFKTVGRWG